VQACFLIEALSNRYAVVAAHLEITCRDQHHIHGGREVGVDVSGGVGGFLGIGEAVDVGLGFGFSVNTSV